MVADALAFLAIPLGILAIFFLIIIAMAVWVYKDAKKRYPEDSSTPVLWLIVVLITGLLGLIIYVIVRPKEIKMT